MQVKNMVNSNGNTVDNQFIITFEDKEVFQSYNSIIAIKYNDGRVELGEDWNYSRTTAKYRNIFLGEGVAETRKKINSGKYKIVKD